MRKTLELNMAEGYPDCETVDLTIRLRIPVVADASAPRTNRAATHGAGPAGDDGEVRLRVSIDRQLEAIREQMRKGTGGKVDEDNLVILRLLQAFGFEFWPIEHGDF